MNQVSEIHAANDANQFIEIGEQIWMLKNLDTEHFQNGDPIPEAKTDKEWKDAGKANKAAWCYYQNDSKYAGYGKLYNWYAVVDPRCIAPNGWHVPSDEEWTKLAHTLGENAGKKLKTSDGWDGLLGFIGGNGDNSTNFSAIPAGYRVNYGGFNSLKKQTFWWSTNEDSEHRAWYRYITHTDTFFRSSAYHKTYGFSVRCLKTL